MAMNYYQLRVHARCAGNFAECVFVYMINNPTEPDDWALAAQLNAVLDDGGPGVSWISKLMALMSEDTFLTTIWCRKIAPGGGNTAVISFAPLTILGTFAGTVGAVQVAACINWVNETPDTHMGRNFIPGISEGALEGSRFTSTYQTAVNAFIAKHVVGFSVAGGIFLPCIFDREAETGVRADDGYLSPKVGTQRKRELPV